MATVYPRSAPPDRPFPLASFLRASTLHVGAAAAAASLREDLADQSLTSSEFDEAYAIARLTPGTNLLAMYTLLGERLAGWRGATTALASLLSTAPRVRPLPGLVDTSDTPSTRSARLT